MKRAQLAAILAVGLGALALAAAAYSAIANFPRGLIVAVLLIAAAAAALYGLIHRGAARIAGLGCAALLLLACVLIVILDGGVPEAIVIAVAAFGAIAAAKAAVAVHVPLPGAEPPARPVLFYNPKSGGGKAERFKVDAEARARGIEPIELRLGTDLGELVAKCRGRGRRRVGDGRRRRLAGDRRRDRLRVRPALRLHPGRHPQPLCPRPRGGPRGRRRCARLIRRRR